MKMEWWRHMLVLGLVCGVGVVGCKKRDPGAGMVGDNIGGVMGTDVYGESLGVRPGEDAEYAEGQFSPVYFDYDSSQVKPSERPAIEAVADYLRANRTVGVVIEGHCDERGSKEYNLALGERRALAARAYLIGLGIDPGRIQTKSYGEEQPVAMGHDESAWNQNRRAEFVLFY